MNETKHYKNFVKNLYDNYGMNVSELKNWKYAGGNQGRHKNYFKLYFGDDILPEYASQCVCGKDIKENCYIHNEETDEILIIGNECIKKFMPKESIGRRCMVCNAPHKNRKNNKCDECRIGFCIDCEKPINSWYKKCFACAN